MLLLLILATVLYAATAEYIAHRWFMHQPIPSRTVTYTDHSVEHHGKRRVDINISMNQYAVFIIGSPMFLGYFCYGWVWILGVALGMILYCMTWTNVHKAHHDLKNKWLNKFPPYRLMRRHHLIHHEHPNKNFGAVFIFSDLLYGTWLNG